MALTQAQRDWARRVYSPRGVLFCHFPMYSERRGWYYCGSTQNVQIHHRRPQGFIRRVFGSNPDYPLNLIAICEEHHNCKNSRYEDCVHPDMENARKNYTKSGRNSYEQAFRAREIATAKNPPQIYWNDSMDEAMQQVIDRIVGNYLVAHKEDPWPEKRKR